VVAQIKQIQSDARKKRINQRPIWPMIVLRTPKGWTGPKTVDGKQTEGSWLPIKLPLSEDGDQARPTSSCSSSG